MAISRRAAEVVLVTGAAGAIGAATVRSFLGAGFVVLGLDRSSDVTKVAADRAFHGIQVELQEETAVAAALDEARNTGRLRHVVGIAGGALPGEPQTQHDPATLDIGLFRRSIEANLTTQFVVLKHALRWLRETDGDRSLTFTSSFNALTGCGMPAYSAAKAGLIGMMHALAEPLGAEGIRVNVVAPGTIRTPRTERLWEHVPDHFERLAETTVLGRLGTPEDVARTFLAVATLLTHFTGQVLVVDGGQMIKRPRSSAETVPFSMSRAI